MTTRARVLVTRSPVRLTADPARVITQLFVPGQEGFEHREPRASPVIQRLLDLDEDEVERSYADVVDRFAGRHRHLEDTFRRNADELRDRVGPDAVLSPTRRLLLGATFTSEVTIEGAALCNPSMVAHPDQGGVAPGSLRFVMSVRAVGEGHRSTIGFRTGVIDAAGAVSVDATPPFATTGEVIPEPLEAAVFRGALEQVDGGSENTDDVLAALGERFSAGQLEDRLAALQRRPANLRNGAAVADVLRRMAGRTYGVQFPAETELAERVLRPVMSAESNGLEDARFVRFVEDDGTVTYCATYTAYDGNEISEQLLETTDFLTFTSSPIVGKAAANKGLALFPRRIGGRFAALSRADRETNAVTFSDNPRHWTTALPCQVPERAWEILQIGNCGSPIETEAGWLVLTHGVGPMRTYSIGAILLDLEEPQRVIGHLREPLLRPAADERDGYVPNVVYSCGGMVHADSLVVPYGIGDAAIGIATVSLPELLTALGG